MQVPSRILEEARISDSASLRAELRLELAQLETRLTKWTALCVIGATAVAIAWTMVFTLRGAAWPGLGLFLLSTAGQLYAVWRM